MKECIGYCIKNFNDSTCCYDCKKNTSCINQCTSFKDGISYDDCFFKSIKLKKGNTFCTGCVHFNRGYSEIKKNIISTVIDKIKNFIKENISWRFKKYPPEN